METRLAAVLFADMVGYSRLVALDEVATVRRLMRLIKDVVEPAIASFDGRFVKSTGDGFLAEFASVVNAVKCAVTIQLALRESGAGKDPNHRIRLRMGINLGEVVVDGDDILGDGVNVAARLEQNAEPGGILVSESVYRQARTKVASGFTPLGAQEMKNLPRPENVYSVEMKPELPGSGEARRQSRPILVATGAAAAILAALLLFLYPLQPQDKVTVTETDVIRPLEGLPSVAVLPFQNNSNDAGQTYLADGVTDDITINLTKAPGLLVIDRESAFNFRDGVGSPNEIAAKLGVRYLLRGSVQRDGDALRVNASLLDTASKQIVWGESFDGTMPEILAFQASIAASIARSLSASLTISEMDLVSSSNINTDNVEAYELFLRGRERFQKFSREDTFAARRYFESALELDPEFANAEAFLAWTHAFEYNNGWAEDAEGALDRALAHAESAIALNPFLPVAHFVRALVYRERKEYPLAMAAARQAININPNYANAYILIATLQYYDGQPAEGLAMIELAERLNPLHPSNYPFHKGQALFILERYEEAVEVLEAGLAQNPTSQRLRVWLAASYAAMGRQDDAEWEAQQILLDDPDFQIARLHHIFPFSDDAQYERFLAALHSAGFAEQS